jgi:6-phosphogluconolactonase
VDVYAVDLGTGALAQAQQGVSAGTDSKWITVDPGGRFVYVANGGGTTSISQFKISPTDGTLSSIAAPIAAPAGINTLAVDPYSEFLYSGNAAPSNSLSAFAIGTNGALTLIGSSTAGIGTDPSGIVVEPTGNYVYATNFTSNDLDAQLINPTTGALTNGVALAGAAPNPNAVAVDPTGNYLYAANTGGGKGISSFKINEDGSLTEKDSPADAGSQYGTLAVNPYLGGFVYGGFSAIGATGGGVATFNEDPISGTFFNSGYSFAPAPNLTMNQVTVDPIGYYVYGIWDEGYIASYPITGTGYATSEGSISIQESPNGHPISIVVAKVPQI